MPWCKALGAGWDESLPADQRARALFQAAIITRTNGMELIGTEVEPDWHVHAGNYEEGVTAATGLPMNRRKSWSPARRSCSAPRRQIIPIRKSASTTATRPRSWPGKRRSCMPNNSDETARVLCTAGCWLKNRDPQTADIFYKALVRRNRKTALGDGGGPDQVVPATGRAGQLIPATAVAPGIHAAARSAGPIAGSTGRHRPGPGWAGVSYPGETLYHPYRG